MEVDSDLGCWEKPCPDFRSEAARARTQEAYKVCAAQVGETIANEEACVLSEILKTLNAEVEAIPKPSIDSHDYNSFITAIDRVIAKATSKGVDTDYLHSGIVTKIDNGLRNRMRSTLLGHIFDFPSGYWELMDVKRALKGLYLPGMRLNWGLSSSASSLDSSDEDEEPIGSRPFQRPALTVKGARLVRNHRDEQLKDEAIEELGKLFQQPVFNVSNGMTKDPMMYGPVAEQVHVNARGYFEVLKRLLNTKRQTSERSVQKPLGGGSRFDEHGRPVLIRDGVEFLHAMYYPLLCDMEEQLLRLKMLSNEDEKAAYLVKMKKTLESCVGKSIPGRIKTVEQMESEVMWWLNCYTNMSGKVHEMIDRLKGKC